MYPCICATADADEVDVILHEKGPVEREYDDEFNDGEDKGNRYGIWIETIMATGMV